LQDLARQCFACMNAAKHRITLRHFAKDCVLALGKAYWDLSHPQIKIYFFVAALPVKKRGRAQGRMPREWQLFCHGEDAYFYSVLPFNLRIARDNKSSFREVGFARQALHFRVAQAAPVSKDGKLVPLERPLCKHIQGDKRNPAHGRSSLLANNT